MATKAKKGARRCFDLSQDLNWYGKRDEFWGKFKEKYPQYKDYTDKQLKTIMDGFWVYSGQVLVETPHGIVLDRIGYLANTVFDNPKKMVYDKRFNKLHVNYVADGQVYRCHFYPVDKDSSFRGWMFTISKEHKKRMKELIQSGMKYKNHIRLLNKNYSAVKSYG